MFVSVWLPLIIAVTVAILLFGIEKARSSKSMWWKR